MCVLAAVPTAFADDCPDANSEDSVLTCTISSGVTALSRSSCPSWFTILDRDGSDGGHITIELDSCQIADYTVYTAGQGQGTGVIAALEPGDLIIGWDEDVTEGHGTMAFSSFTGTCVAENPSYVQVSGAANTGWTVYRVDTSGTLTKDSDCCNEHEAICINRGPLDVSKIDDVNDGDCRGPGQEITYTISYQYRDDPNLTQPVDVNIVDFLPRSVFYVSSSPEGTYDFVTHSVAWEIGQVGPGDSNSVSVTVEVTENAYVDLVVHNEAVIYWDSYSIKVPEDTPVCCPPGDVVYVRAGAPDGGNGMSWATAFNDLHKGLLRAERCSMQVWVAAGVYSPGPSVTDSYVFLDGVSVYGGFSGIDPCETVESRNLSSNKTVLSGKISESKRNNNVVRMRNNSVLNGCVVEGAAGDSDDGSVHGENVNFTLERCTVQQNLHDGIRVLNGSATIKWCIIMDNEENGIYSDASAATGKTLTIDNSHIFNNGRSGVFARYCEPTVRNCFIALNGFGTYYEWLWPYCGIRLDVPSGTPLIRNCTITHNKSWGVCRYLNWDLGTFGSVPQIRNTILWANNRDSGSYGPQNTGGVNMHYSCVMNNPMPDPNNCINSDPNFAYSDPNLFSYCHLMPDSSCVNAGDNVSSIDYSAETDIDGHERVFDNVRVDIGADEVTCSEVRSDSDWNQDGIINFIEFATVASAWASHEPGTVIDPNDAIGWDGRCDFNSDDVIDMKDIAAFAQIWLWQACWRESGTGFARMSMPSGEGELMLSCAMSREISVDSIASVEFADSQVTEQDLLGILDWLDIVVEDGDMTEYEVLEVRLFIEAELDTLRTQTSEMYQKIE